MCAPMKPEPPVTRIVSICDIVCFDGVIGRKVNSRLGESVQYSCFW